MTRIAVVVPTIGRPELIDTLESLAPQLADGDRVMVACDNLRRYDFCSEAVGVSREESADGATWRCYPLNPPDAPLGHYGHPARNVMLDLLVGLEHGVDWVWSIDDDDVATFGALDMIRAACSSGDHPWYVFRMKGGAGSHFAGVSVPTMGNVLGKGNVGTPMIVFPTEATARFGLDAVDGHEPGYFGDWQLAVALQQELGAPGWVEAVVAEIRPAVDA